MAHAADFTATEPPAGSLGLPGRSEPAAGDGIALCGNAFRPRRSCLVAVALVVCWCARAAGPPTAHRRASRRPCDSTPRLHEQR
ncbi:hypothetical protein HMPREF0591_2572 [Mycobacterium parascrofulaceum ATCC BAA-614]|uniref:Uncharacterized protein n=1 Tax=Mycobacterium parascrofulaceum ATCC BAA-614 TaxID=525368 RepID=D5P8S8_9MYCO|nr:hypothetical protein HMPREF0591_2572 [Mycobacterium parascrofulaceum ATCC BAA-614]